MIACSPSQGSNALEEAHAAQQQHHKLLHAQPPAKQPAGGPAPSQTPLMRRISQEPSTAALPSTQSSPAHAGEASPADPTGQRMSRLGPHPPPPSMSEQVTSTPLAPLPPAGQPPPRRPSAQALAPQPPQLLPRSVAAAPALLRSSQGADAAASGEAVPTSSEEVDEPTTLGERGRWQHKLSKLRRGEPTQPLSVLMAAGSRPQQDPGTPEGNTPPVVSASPSSLDDSGGTARDAAAPPSFAKFNYYNEEDEEQGSNPASPTKALTPVDVPGRLTFRAQEEEEQGGNEEEARGPAFELDSMQDMLNSSNGAVWKAQLREELEVSAGVWYYCRPRAS